ncbi:MAG: cell division protein FtsQ/DivIB [Candidatus Sedimenticola sp. (ex Thyasira tokunagai)]
MSSSTAKRGGKKVQEIVPLWRRLGSWSLALVLFAMMGIGAVWGTTALRDPSVLPLEVVRIDGDFNHLKRSDLEHAIGRVMQGNFFTIDLDAVRDAALSLPWVEQVTVRRIWPGTLKVWVGEQAPLGRWGKQRLVSARGVVFTPKPEEIPSGLPILSGADEDSQEVVTHYLEMVRRIADLPLTIERAGMDGRRSWKLVFKQGLTLRLGSRDRELRLAQFVRLYRQFAVVDGKQLKVMDLRYTNGVAVRWEDDKKDKKLKTTDSVTGKRLGLILDDAGGQV